MVSSEAHPFAKSGGLADVVGALPIALAELGVESAVVLPRYQSISLDGAELALKDLRVYLGDGYHLTNIWARRHRGVTFYFVDCPYLYDRAGLYGDHNGEFGDNAVRYAVLCGAALGIARHLFRPDIIHCHDWQAGLVPLFLKFMYPNDPTFAGVKTVFSIHNVGYQGQFPRHQLRSIGLDERFWNAGAIEFHGAGSMMKAGIVWSDYLTTVSPTHAREIQSPEYGFGMDGLLRSRADHLVGILNGVDYDDWNPETDPYIAAHFSADDLSGKRVCKRALVEFFGLPAAAMDRPLIGIVSRLAYQKGFDIVGQAILKILGEDVSMVVLGSGEAQYESMFNHFAWARPDRFRVWLGFNNALAHQIEAGSDMFLMPSRYEPCGLNQIYSLRYGTLPVVRATGGLEDTVDADTGFKFWGFSGDDLHGALKYALGTYRDHPERWQYMMKQAMRRDFSWTASAREYAALYRKLAPAALPPDSPVVTE